MDAINVFSFGGGVQSMAALVLAAQGKIKVDAFIFANVGEDSENPDTLVYLETVAKPFAEKHGIPLVTVAKAGRTLYQQASRTDLRSTVVPAYRGQGGQTNRNCTVDWKIKVVNKWVKAHYAGQRVRVGLGISTDEWSRLRSTDWHETEGKQRLGFTRARWYPLFDLGLSRHACAMLIQQAGLPIPPKSSCFFCPFMKKHEWVTLRTQRPDLFEKAAQLEDALNAKGIGGGAYYSISQYQAPLRQAVPESWQLPLWLDKDDGDCATGYCHT